MEPILIRRACSFVALLALAGCQRMSAESVVHADGGGSRTLTLVLDEDAPTADPGLYMGVTTARGWKPTITEETGDDGTLRRLPTHYRQRRVDRLADWAEVSGDLRVLGAAPGKPHAEVALANRVSVERGQTTWTYRETFTWNGALEVLAGVVADRFGAEIAAAYPRLDKAQLAELRGLAAGVCTMGARATAGVDGGLELDEDLAVATLVDLARPVIGGDSARLRDIAAAAIEDQPGVIEAFLERELPGYSLAGATTLELSVVLPGRVVETNGQVGDDGKVTWSFQLGDPLVAPRTCWARSEVRD